MSILDRFRKKGFDRPAAPDVVTLLPIGHVRNAVQKPRPSGWEDTVSIIELLPEHERRVYGLDRYSHAIVVTYLDLAADAPEKPEQMTLASGNVYGIFATRSQLRPNHLGVSVVPVVALAGLNISVRGLDAIDGSIVLDIKPYLPEYDAVPGATIPEGKR
ncbi:MAG: TrmO family methyltransferase [Dehalococcoidia bacterium]|nr:TrmO family methyltransferase [Dehalococcoidia bacterium]